MPKRDDDDRDRPSWREIDRRKDSSSHIDKTDPYKKGRRGARTDSRSKSYKAALDSFFEGGALPDRYQKLTKTRESLAKGPGSQRQAALKRLREAIMSRDVAEAVKEFMEIDGALPRDADALISTLQHPDESVVRDAIALLKEIATERPLKRVELLRQRLRKVEDLAEEEETAAQAAELRGLIG